MRRLYCYCCSCLVFVVLVLSDRIEADESYVIANVFHGDVASCGGNLPICRFVERFRADGNIGETALRPSNPQKFHDREKTEIEARSYYHNAYGSSPVGPALYPAIDTVSVLASLAFLAFLLHSFASLFDRSRSIIPSIVTNRRVSGRSELPDPVKLVLRALDEYDILSNVKDNNEVGNGKIT